MWLSLPHLVYNSVRSPTATRTGTGTNLSSVLTELYISSTSTQSPTRSLKSHVWSSSSGNNYHAVHRSLSSGASVYECTMGISFTSSHFISQFLPTRFHLITGIRMCHFLPVHHFEWHFWPGRRPKYNTLSPLMFNAGISSSFVFTRHIVLFCLLLRVKPCVSLPTFMPYCTSIWVSILSVLRMVQSILQFKLPRYLFFWWDYRDRSWYQEVFLFFSGTPYLFFRFCLLDAVLFI